MSGAAASVPARLRATRPPPRIRMAGRGRPGARGGEPCTTTGGIRHPGSRGRRPSRRSPCWHLPAARPLRRPRAAARRLRGARRRRLPEARRRGQLQRGVPGVPAGRRGREHVGAARRVPLRVEEAEGRLHPAGAASSSSGKGVDPHRKVGVMVRTSLDADSPYADAAVHGDGLTSLQFRRDEGGRDRGDRARRSRARTCMQLERRGTHAHDVGGALRRAVHGDARSTDLALGDDVYVGLFVCSHNADVVERGRLPRRAHDRGPRPRTASCPTATTSAAGSRSSTWRRAARQLIHASAGPVRGAELDARRQGADLQHQRPRRRRAAGSYRFDLATRKRRVIDTRLRDPQQQRPRAVVRRHAARDQRPAPGRGQSTVYTLPVDRRRRRSASRRTTPSYLHGWSPDGQVAGLHRRRATASTTSTGSPPTAAATRSNLTRRGAGRRARVLARRQVHLLQLRRAAARCRSGA